MGFGSSVRGGLAGARVSRPAGATTPEAVTGLNWLRRPARGLTSGPSQPGPRVQHGGAAAARAGDVDIAPPGYQTTVQDRPFEVGR
jgi:hypothetical protein